MTFEQAQELLRTAVKSELRDHAFGDCEIVWFVDDEHSDIEGAQKDIASGYFGSGEALVSIESPHEERGSFKGAEAHELRKCFSKEITDRNDSTGPDTFVEGQVMEGLTLEGVKKELGWAD